MTITPNRVAVYLTGLSGLAAAVAIPVANLDTTSTVGVLGGLVPILVAAVKWLDGWQKHEAAARLGQIPYVTGTTANYATDWGVPPAAPQHSDEDNSALEATDGDALAPTGPVLGGDE